MTDNQVTPLYAERNPVVTIRDGEAFANSRDVAAFFGKQHFAVLRDVRNLIEKAPELARANFVAFKTNDLTGESTSHFDMDRDGFTLLAMGFTGSKALKWKMAYIKAFNAMEAEIKRQAAEGRQAVDLNDPGQLRGLLLSYTQRAEELQAQVDELAPKGEALARISEADGSLCVTDAAKALQMRPKDLFAYLRQNGWIYRRAGSGHDLGYQSKTTTGLLEHKVTTVLRADGSEKVTEQVRITPKGLTRLASLIHPAIRAA